MSEPTLQIEQVQQALADFNDPESGRSVVKMEQVSDIAINGDTVSLNLALTPWAGPIAQAVRSDCIEHLRQRLPQAQQIEVTLSTQDRPAQRIGQMGLAVKSVIAIGSGKGGVGKSTVAASLASALRVSGAKVGLLDADVYGPSIPHMMGIKQKPAIADNKIQPIEKDGLKLMSMGFIVDEGQAAIWRGPMLDRAIKQMLGDTHWDQLDYLLIDMPPGTGDVAITLSQSLPISGAVVVCTPQDVALLDAVKAVAMFHKVNIPLLGIVENMSYFLCPDNGKRYEIFGSGGAREKAIELRVPYLGEVPIQIAIRERGDAGETAANLQDHDTGRYYQAIAAQLVHNLVLERAKQPEGGELPVL